MAYHSIKTKIIQAKQMKKALQPKQLIPIETEEIANPDIVPDEDVADFDDWQLTSEEIRAGLEIRNQKLQDHLDKYENPFPIHVFPKKIQAYILDLEKCINAPIEYTATGILTVVAGAIGNKFHAQLKAGLTTSPMLYAVLIGHTGINKSTPLNEVLTPLYIMEKSYAKNYDMELRNYRLLNDENKKGIAPPVERRCMVNDITMEALLDILISNDVTVFYDEFKGFLNSMNKYRSGDDMEKWLSIWSGSQIRADRKGKRGAVISAPFANCIGTIQPDVLLNFLNQNNTNNGYNERLLYVTTNQPPNGEWTEFNRNEGLKNEYIKTVLNIFEVPSKLSSDGELEPNMVIFDSTAFQTVMDWQHKNTKLCNSTSDNQLKGVYKKLEIYVIRFSLIMAIMDYAATVPALLRKDDIQLKITQKHTKAAICIAEYFRNSAKNIYALKPKEMTTKNLDKRFLAFFENLSTTFTTERALEIGKELKLAERTVYYYLREKYFRKIKRGYFEKTYELK
jgi:hypothetical protein